MGKVYMNDSMIKKTIRKHLERENKESLYNIKGMMKGSRFQYWTFEVNIGFNCNGEITCTITFKKTLMTCNMAVN